MMLFRFCFWVDYFCSYTSAPHRIEINIHPLVNATSCRFLPNAFSIKEPNLYICISVYPNFSFVVAAAKCFMTVKWVSVSRALRCIWMWDCTPIETPCAHRPVHLAGNTGSGPNPGPCSKNWAQATRSAPAASRQIWISRARRVGWSEKLFE